VRQMLGARDRNVAWTDGMFTVLFSTTPLSASRKYSVNIPSVNAFLCQRLSQHFRHHHNSFLHLLTSIRMRLVSVEDAGSTTVLQGAVFEGETV